MAIQLLEDSIAVNGVTFKEGIGCYLSRKADHSIIAEGQNLADALDKEPLSAFPKGWSVKIRIRTGEVVPDYKLVRYIYTPAHDFNSAMIGIEFLFFPTDWAQPYSINDFSNLLSETARIALPQTKVNLVLAQSRITFENVVQASSLSFRNATTFIETAIVPMAASIEEELRLRTKHDSLVTIFEFPTEVSTACEQYLIFFGEFLRSLGVQAKTDLAHEAGKVLFSVTPDDGKSALELISDALGIYLQLPTAPAPDISSFQHDPRTQTLVANIHFLQSQLAMANAISFQKDLTIAALHGDKSRQTLTGSVVTDSVVAIKPMTPKGGSQPLRLGPMVLKKFEGKWVDLDVPEMLRWLWAKASGQKRLNSDPSQDVR